MQRVYFAYSTNKTLHLSEDEKVTIMEIFKMIENELNSRIDDFSQDVWSLLKLSYC